MTWWLHGVAVVCIATALRLCVAMINDPQGSPIYEFGFTDSKSSPSAWKEYLILQLHGVASSPVHVSTYPWLRFVTDAGGSRLNELLLNSGWWLFGAVDGFVALLFWAYATSNSMSIGACWAHALNPLLLFAAHLHSAAPVEYAALFLLVHACGSDAIRKKHLLIRSLLAVGFVCVLGFGHLAAAALLLFDIVCPSRTRAIVAASGMVLLAAVLVTWDAVNGASVLRSHELPTRLASMSPDVGPSWYVWQLMPPVFDRPYTTIMKWMPVVMTAPVLLRSTIHATGGGGTAVQQRRQFVAVWSVCASLVCRPTFTIPDVVFAVELICLVTPNIAKRMDHLFLPVVGTCMCLPLQRAFYFGWVSMRVMNANWLFFTCVFQMAAFVMFLISYLVAFFEGITHEETGSKKLD